MSLRFRAGTSSTGSTIRAAARLSLSTRPSLDQPGETIRARAAVGRSSSAATVLDAASWLVVLQPAAKHDAVHEDVGARPEDGIAEALVRLDESGQRVADDLEDLVGVEADAHERLVLGHAL